jgi:hypothetical protein
MTVSHQQALLGPDGCLTSALAEGDALALRVSGVCMEPDLRSQALVRVERSKRFWPGDVVAFHCSHQNRLLMHRCLGYVRSRGAWKLMTMADRGPSPDVLVDLSRVLGRIGAHAGAPYRPSPLKRMKSMRRYALWCVRFLIRRLTTSGVESAVARSPIQESR